METEILSNSYKIKTGSFEGPFSLLLSLVEDRKLFINDVSLAEVTEDYLNYVNKLQASQEFSTSTQVAEMSSFIVVAATLILIKSKSLLPNLNLTSEEESDIKNLEDRLRQYEQFSKLSLHIKNNFGQNIIFSPLERKNDFLVFLPDDQITADSMMGFARTVLGRMPKKTFLPEVEVRKVINIEEMIEKLMDRIQSSIKTSFKDFSGKSGNKEEKVFVIVSFLAMLELVRKGVIDAAQEGHGEDIIIEKQEIEINL